MKQSELAAQLTASADKVDKVFTEVDTLKKEFEELKTQLGDSDVSPELQAVADRIGASLQRLDDLNEDAAAPAPAESGS